MTTPRGRGRRTATTGRSRWERFMFSFMGPPQLGDLNAPVREAAPRPVELCGKCGQSYDAHEIVRDRRLTYSRCPAVGA